MFVSLPKHLWFRKCSKLRVFSQNCQNRQKSGCRPVRGDGFGWIRTPLMTHRGEHLLKTIPLGTPPSVDPCCTSVHDGSKRCRHFQNGIQASQRCQPCPNSSVRWREVDDFMTFSWFSLKTRNFRKRLSYCGVWDKKNRENTGLSCFVRVGLKQGDNKHGF